MKRVFRIMGLCALVALVAVSCKKDEQNNGSKTFKATISQPTSDSKTQIGDSNWLVWSAGDQIKVYTESKTEAAAANFTIATGVGQTDATFSGTLAESSDYYAFYPAEGVVVESGLFKLPLGGTQTFADGGFASNTYPMFATAGSDGNFQFQSPCGILAIPMKGTATVGSIVLTGKNASNAAQDLSGCYWINPESADHNFDPSGQTITLSCGDGVTLNETTATTFHFVVPGGAFEGGFTIKVFGTDNTELLTKDAPAPQVVPAQTIRIMGEVTGVSPNITDPRFTVNVAEGRQVYLASGNLQYQPSTHTWRFAENPWNFVGGQVGSNEYGNVYEGGVKCRNNYISDTYSGWIDLFGWGTKDNPTETNNNDDEDEGPLYIDYYSTTFSDWGDNIEPDMHWRTLKGDEWACLMGKTSADASRTTYGYFGGVEQVNARYAMVTLDGVTGVILFPDVYYHPAGVAVPQSFGDASTSLQTAYTQAEWNQMAANGAIFLPTQTGYRRGTAYGTGVNNCYYWTSTYYNTNNNQYYAWRVTITSSQINASETGELFYGYSVRLARNAE